MITCKKIIIKTQKVDKAMISTKQMWKNKT